MNSKDPKIIKLTPPKLSLNNIKENVACIRGHRERIFQTYPQELDGKQVFHNYGHGGAGWTFLFGCVNESIRQFEDQLKNNTNLKDKPICIIGAGCYGLLTAIVLIRKGYKVQIIAKEIEEIPSNKAAGFFFPRHRKCSNTEEKEIFRVRGIESYKTYKQIAEGNHPFIKTGPKQMPVYFEPTIDPGFGPYIAEGLINEPEEVVINFGGSKHYKAIEYKIVFINAATVMAELKREAKELNVKITKKEIKNFAEVEEKIVFNCAGFGAKELANDKRMVPVQGHLITLQDQPIEQLQYMINFKFFQPTAEGKPRDELIYFAPREDGILGVTFKRGESSLEANPHEFERLLARCREFFEN
jgi:D-amino-acid oxidase